MASVSEDWVQARLKDAKWIEEKWIEENSRHMGYRGERP